MLQRLFDLLLVKGVVATGPQSEPTPAQRLEQEFRQYLNRERRVARATVFLYLPFARRFLAECFADRELQLDTLRASDVVRFVQREAIRLQHPKRAKLMTTALRSFLQYARYRGLISIDLRSSVPTVASWSMASLPKGLSPDEVQRLLAHCERQTSVGRRDWAILLLLARLGLRAGEVVGLTLDDSIGSEESCAFAQTGGVLTSCRFRRMSGPRWSTICVMRVPHAPAGKCLFA